MKKMFIGIKLILVFLIISVIPITIFGTINYINTEKQIINDTFSKLEAISKIQENRVENIIDQNYERLASLTSRLQLRLALNDHNVNGTQESQELMNNILSAAKSGISSFTDIHILNPRGDIVASTDTEQIGTNHAVQDFFVKGKQQNDISVFFKDNNQNLRGFLTGPLLLEGKFIGVVSIVSDAENLLSQFASYEGLGETGESVMAKRTPEGNALYVTPLRFDKNAALQTMLPIDRTNSPTVQALSKNEGTFANLVDYRGQPVLAATRYIESMDWGLVTKIDKVEAFAPLDNVRNFMILSGITLSILIVIASLYLGRLIATPITKLRDAAREISKGNFEAEIIEQADDTDEIKETASSFEAMRKYILSTNRNLEKLVQSKTKELQEANQQLALANRQLETRDRMQKEFINIAAHELRTPIVPILNLSELLYSKALLHSNVKGQQQEELAQQEEQQNEMLAMLQTILRNANRLHQLTEDILDVTRIESNTLKLRKERFNLNDAIVDAVEDYREQIAHGNVKLMYERGNNNTLVEADRRRVTQVISNLLNNSVKFTKEGTVTVSTNIERNDGGDKGEEVLVAVKDTGTGIDPELMPRLFTKFATKSYQGTGLGLYISKSIIEAHGGKMWAENNNNGDDPDRKQNGATFYFTIPIAEINKQTREEKKKKKEEEEVRLVND
jgi:signal transduction histidine kinase